MATNPLFEKLKGKQSLSPEKLQQLKEAVPELYAEYEASKHVNIVLAQFITAPAYDVEMNTLKEAVRKLSTVNDPVLIRGETGTGKELIAQALHGEREGRFIAINCAGIPETLIESELFGHVKGAFTGAIQEKTGLLQSAHGGTIFLDEIGDLPLTLQAKLLRAIQEKKIRKVGADYERGETDTGITCRFISATHKNLPEMVAKGLFREDLYYRISAFKLETKPLRERTAALEPLVRHFAAQDLDTKNFQIKDVAAFVKQIVDSKCTLPGNVRQLQNIIRNYHVLGKIELT